MIRTSKHSKSDLSGLFYRLPVYWKSLLTIALVLTLSYSTELILYFFVLPPKSQPDYYPEAMVLLRGFSLYFVSHFFVSALLLAAFEIPRKRLRPRWWHLVLFAVLGYPASLAIFIIYRILRAGFTDIFTEEFTVFNGIANYPQVLISLMAYAMILFWESARVEHENALKAESLANEAKWQMLRYQVNPHFLFNSLNSIMALINEDKKLARSVVNELSSYFRHTLSWNGKSVISVDEELNAVMHYLYIQKIRFENRIRVSFNIEDEMREFLIPVFGLQSLIENAIKYGIKTHEGTVNILVEAYIDKDYSIIKVSNTGKLFKHDSSKEYKDNEGTRSGLENLKGRLDLLYPDKNSLSLYEDGGMVIAEIKINTVRSLVK